MQPNLIEQLESRQGAMRVHDVALFLGEAVDEKHIYRMAARGQMPSFRIGGAICFDPQELAKWLREKYAIPLNHRRKPVRRVRAVEALKDLASESSNAA